MKSSSWLTAGNIFAKAISTIALPILARILGPEKLGIYNFVTSTAQSGMSFMTLGTDVAMHRNGARVDQLGAEAIGRLFGVGLSFSSAVGMLTGLILYVFHDPLALLLLGDPGAGGWLAVAALIIAIQPLGVMPMLIMASLQEFRGYALRTILMLLVGNVITVVLAAYDGIDGAIAAAVITALLQVVLNYLFVAPLLRSRGIRLRYDGYWLELRGMLSFGFPYYFGNTLLGSVIGIPIMGILVKNGSMHDLGYLRVAQSMSSIISFIPSTIGPAVITHLMASSIEGGEQYRSLRFGHMRMIWIFLLIATAGFSLLMPVCIVPLFGESFRNAIYPSSVMLWLGLLMGVTTAMIQQLLVKGRTLLIGVASSVGVAVWFIASVMLIPVYHLNGYIIAQVIGQIAGTVIVVGAYHAAIPQSERRALWWLSLASLLSAFVTFSVTLAAHSPVILSAASAAIMVVLSVWAYSTVLLASERNAIRTQAEKAARRLFTKRTSGHE